MITYTKLLELAKNNNEYLFTKDLNKKIAKDYLKVAVENGILVQMFIN